MWDHHSSQLSVGHACNFHIELTKKLNLTPCMEICESWKEVCVSTKKMFIWLFKLKGCRVVLAMNILLINSFVLRSRYTVLEHYYMVMQVVNIVPFSLLLLLLFFCISFHVCTHIWALSWEILETLTQL